MTLLNFLRNNQDLENIIYVLEVLLKISIKESYYRGQIDLDLYKILNDSEINQKAIHEQLLSVTRHGKKPSESFLDFINNLSIYMEYDLNYETYYFNTRNTKTSNELYNKVLRARNIVIDYLYHQKLITDEQYEMEQNKQLKRITL